ncbi:2,3-diketo-L-gulonate reductase [Pasteurella multocida]|nr:2,3-diketo-L-gulonate reductase [Pasteurella multocida]
MKVSYEALKQEFKRVLLARNVREDIAEECATMFADTTESGVYSHGVNRFPRFISQLEKRRYCTRCRTHESAVFRRN